MKIRNIKASIILKKPLVDHTLNSTHTIFKVKCKNSFITLTLYRKKPHILNATGIKNFRILKLFLSQIKEFYVSHKIDTVFYIQKTILGVMVAKLKKLDIFKSPFARTCE